MNGCTRALNWQPARLCFSKFYSYYSEYKTPLDLAMPIRKMEVAQAFNEMVQRQAKEQSIYLS